MGLDYSISHPPRCWLGASANGDRAIPVDLPHHVPANQAQSPAADKCEAEVPCSEKRRGRQTRLSQYPFEKPHFTYTPQTPLPFQNAFCGTKHECCQHKQEYRLPMNRQWLCALVKQNRDQKHFSCQVLPTPCQQPPLLLEFVKLLGCRWVHVPYWTIFR